MLLDISTPVSRRTVLRSLAATGVVAGLGPLAAACGDGAKSSSNVTLKLHHDAAEGPVFKPFVDYFNAHYKPITLGTSYVASNYATVTNTQLAAGGVDYDVLFVGDGYTRKWAQAGLIAPLDGFDGAEQMKDRWLPGFAEQNVDANGHLISLPYFQGLELFLYNEQLLGSINAQPPTTWDELIHQCRELKNKGLNTPYGPFWTADFDMIWYEFIAESYSDGAQQFFGPADQHFAPYFAEDPVAHATLQRWQAMYREGLVPQDIFTTSYGDVANIYAGGKAAYTVRYGPQAKGYNDPKQSKIAGHSKNALMPGKTGTSFSFPAHWAMTESSQHKPQAWELMQYLAGKDKFGAYYVPKNCIALSLGLLTPYEAVNKDPDVAKAWGQWADVALINKQLAQSKTLGPVVNETWFGKFQDSAAGTLTDIVRGKTSVSDGLKTMADVVKANAS